jgi:hypothetical protein
MRGLSLRLAASALALTLGAAGAHSLGAPSPAGEAQCSAAVASTGDAAGLPHLASPGFTHLASAGGGWKRAESDRTRAGSHDQPKPCRKHVASTRRHRQPGTTRLASSGLPARGSSGLLGLAATPANAPPGS